MASKQYPYQNLFLEDIKGERWKDIPYLDGAYQISNYGRVKRLRRWFERYHAGGFWLKEKIRKPVVQTQIVSKGKRKLYRLASTAGYEGKKYDIPIARLVYYLFVKKFDLDNRKLIISFKDEDPFNICAGNLVLTTLSKRITESYTNNHRPRESFGKKALAVTQYNLAGQRIASYPSINAAEQATGLLSSQISDAVLSKSHYSGGYIWVSGNRKSNLPKIPAYVKKKIASENLHSSIVTQYNLAGDKIREYPTIKAAAKAVKVQYQTIRRVVLGLDLTAKGYHWQLGSGPGHISLGHIIEKKQRRYKRISRPVLQFGQYGKQLEIYPSIAEAARQTGIPAMNIFCALKRSGSSGGFLWRYCSTTSAYPGNNPAP
jgi:NUMOD4 motif/NUMOD1 domain